MSMDPHDIFGALIAGTTVFAWFFCFGYFLEGKIRNTCRPVPCHLDTNATSIEWPTNFLLSYDILFGSVEKGRPRFWRAVLISFIAILIIGFNRYDGPHEAATRQGISREIIAPLLPIACHPRPRLFAPSKP